MVPLCTPLPLRACRSRFQRCSVFFRGLSVLVLLRFHFLSRPSATLLCLPAEGGCGCLIGSSFQYWVGPSAPLVLEPLLSASAQSPPLSVLPLVAGPMRCASCKRPVSPPARPSQLSPFRQRGPEVPANKHVSRGSTESMHQSRAERCISVGSQVMPLSSSFFPLI